MDISPYIDHYLTEIKVEEEKTDKLYLELYKKVRKTAIELGVKYKLDKIYLFGSLTDRELFHLNSDIDLAVKGLNSEDYFNLWGELEEELNHSFDLVNMSKINDKFYSRIVEEGVVIYDGQKA